MTNPDALLRENHALRERISTLSAAMLRISASLDLDTVLQEIAQSARALTGAGCGIITTVDGDGQVEHSVFSGFPPEEQALLEAWPDALGLFGHFRDLPGPVRLADLGAYISALGLPVDRIRQKSFLGTPVRRREVHVGNFFLGDKEGGEEFTDENEEVLVLFASQAAAAIVNARTHRAEQRTRADLEALVETSPVGVAVFDARTGTPVSFNREAERLVTELRTPGQPVEQLLEVLTCRFADGRAFALEGLSLSQALSNAQNVHGQEIVLSVPDGRSVTTLLNATPIRSEGGEVVSVVVTMQDLAPLHELDRLRAEFLGMVSHELRAPLTSIRGSADTLLDAWEDLDRAEMREFFRLIAEQTEQMQRLIADLLDAGRIDTGTLSVSPESSQVADLVDRARTTFASGGGRQAVLIDLPLDLPHVMADRRRIVQVLNNLLSNAARHSPQSSAIRVAAEREGIDVAISITDEGRGLAPDRLTHLFQKYAGDGQRGLGGGLGLAICKGLVEAHGGRIRAESGGAGQGARFTFTVPVADGGVDATGTWHGTDADSPEPAPILVVDDDPHALHYVRDALATAGYSAIVTGDHRKIGRIIEAERPQLVLLDLMLPGTDGIELMHDVAELADLPVIFISGYARDETIAKALRAGAVDYIVKPFSATELTARVGAALRRRAEPEPFVVGELAIDYPRRKVTVGARPIELTATEYEVLRLLSLNGERVTTYDTVMRRVWRRRNYGNPKLVRAFVKTIRRKLGDDAANPTYIFNVRGIGYRMGRPDAQEP